MAGKQLKRFERWRAKLPENSAYLVMLVLDEVVPMFEQQGFQRFPDYAGDSGYAVGANTIALQRRSGAEWPTVEIQFGDRGRPFLSLYFAMLPETCFRFGADKNSELPRQEANVVEGKMACILCKGEPKDFDGNFGCASFFGQMLCSKKKIRSEIDKLKALLPWTLDLLDRGIPPDWQAGRGKVHANAIAIQGAFAIAQAAAQAA